jgi:hypothetical protein
VRGEVYCTTCKLFLNVQLSHNNKFTKFVSLKMRGREGLPRPASAARFILGASKSLVFFLARSVNKSAINLAHHNTATEGVEQISETYLRGFLAHVPFSGFGKTSPPANESH